MSLPIKVPIDSLGYLHLAFSKKSGLAINKVTVNNVR